MKNQICTNVLVNRKNVNFCSKFFSAFVDFFTKGHVRSIKAKRNVFASFIYRGINMAIGFMLVPIALEYLNPTRYGIWLTISSIVGWFSILDIGLANGLRTKFAEAIAKDEKNIARIYLSTTYVIISVIIGIFFILFLCINPLLNWANILNADLSMANELSMLAIIIFGFFSLRFVFQIINTILLADQKPSVIQLADLISKIVVLIIIFILTKTTSGSLIYLGFVYSAVPIFILILASIYFYSRDYREFVPSIKYVNFKYSKNLMSLGVNFFFIQISGIILFATDNMIITQLYDPSYVTPYQIAHQYFFVVITLFTIIISPFWSAVTEAYTKNDTRWIKNSVKKLIYVWICFVGITIVMVLISGWVYKVWIGNKVVIPLQLSIGMALFVIIRTFNSPFTSFMNGIGKVKVTLYIYLFIGLINIPLSIFFAKYLYLGVTGVILATAVCFLISGIILTIQYNKIINKKAKGIWDQ